MPPRDCATAASKMIDIDTALTRARPAYQARLDGERDSALGRIDPGAGATDVLNSEASEEACDAEIVETKRGSLRQLYLAVAELFDAVNSALQDEWDMTEECVQRASSILKNPSLFAQPGAPATSHLNKPSTHIRGGLAPWQIRRVTTYVEGNLEATIRISDLAALVKLSSYYFCRAFRSSFDDSPHRYVMRRRVELAQGQMLTTNATLAQIAAECGMADQAHFNRSFRRFVGENPSSWRRARIIASAGVPSTRGTSEAAPDLGGKPLRPPRSNSPSPLLR
jgi:AraC family transcriptional regulator